MNITISMPQLGLTMTEGTVVTWLKKPGDTVKKDDVVLVISTDKVDMDVESITDGVLRKIIVDEGDTVPVGTPLAYIEADGDEIDCDQPVSANDTGRLQPSLVDDKAQDASFPADGSTELHSQTTSPQFAGRTEHAPASPRAKRRARQLGIDITTVKGSGPGGWIAEEDLPKAAAENSSHTTGNVDSRRQRIADRMVESITTIPAFSVSVEVNAERLVTLYESLRDQIQRVTGVKLTYTDLLLKALAVSLANTPVMNSVWHNGVLHHHPTVNLALAVATDRGVIAPVLTDADRLPIQQLVIHRSELAEKARQGRLALTDLEGGIGTLSNLGMYRVDRFEGLISPGQTFILAVGKLRNRPWVDTSLVIKPTIILNLSVDHRVADGAIAATLLERLAETIEQPDQIALDTER
jgi:pyruvate dehydrogenase E2 component (dihydrolipoamide acetyltransferase)